MNERLRKKELEEFLISVCQNSAIYYQSIQMLPSVKYLCGQGKIIYIEKSRKLDICEAYIPNYRGKEDDWLIDQLLEDSEIIMGCESHECLGSHYVYTISLQEGIVYRTIGDDSVEKEVEGSEEDTDKLTMNNITLINASCADQVVDAVVNAANGGLWAGGGICGVIFAKAGMRELTAACSQYETPLKDGSAVITPAFNMKNAKAIIHAVGPNFSVTPTAFKELYEAYYNSLKVLMDNGYHSIAFPLISSGIFGGALSNPAGESAKQCLRAYRKFIADYPDYGIDVKLCAFTASEMAAAEAEI